jgi:hypothetical protein
MSGDQSMGGKAPTPPSRGAGAVLLENLTRLTTDTLTPRLEAMFASCDDYFFDLASRAKNNNDQNLYFESLREIRVKKPVVVPDFCRRLSAGFHILAQRSGGSAGVQAPPIARTPESLELVGNEELEKDVVVIDMVSKARMEWQEELFQLQERIQSIASQSFEEREMPLDPERIARAFIESCNLIQADIKILKLLYKQFDRHVMRQLEELYSSANQLLIDDNVLPDLKPLASQTLKRKPAAAVAEKPGAAMAPEPQGLGLEGIPDSEPQMRELAQLLVRLRNVGVQVPNVPVPGGPIASGTPIGREELVALISEAQSQGMTAGQAPAPLDIRQAIRAIVETHGNLSVGQADEDIINVISMFFDLVLDDRNLPSEIKALVGRLQLPILRVALKDRSFFSDRKHPARQLINEIARTSMGWDAADKESQDELFVRLTALVDEILLAAGEDPGVFERSLSTLLGFIERSDQRAAKAERRTSERAQAEARTSKARDMARHVLHERLEAKQLPAEITTFLIEDWQQVLQLVYLKHGKDGVEWSTAVQVADDLLWSAQPHADERSQRRLERLLPGLYDRITVGLDQTQSTPEDARARIDVIRGVHRVLTGVSPDPLPVVAPLSLEQRRRITPAPSTDEKAWREMTAVERQRVQYEALMFEYLKRADEVPVGSWFEYDDLRQAVSRRCKLATRIDETQTLIFVSRMGVQVYEKPRKAFAYDMQMGHARPVEDAPLFDRTVDRIASNLRRLAGE